METSVESIVADAVQRAEQAIEFLARNKLNDDTVKQDISINVEQIIDEARDHARIMSFYSSMYSTVKSAITVCDHALSILEGELYDYYSQEYSVQLKTTEVKYYITHDSKYRKLIRHKSILTVQNDRLAGIMKAFEARGYSINNITKLLLIKHEQSKVEA